MYTVECRSFRGRQQKMEQEEKRQEKNVNSPQVLTSFLWHLHTYIRLPAVICYLRPLTVPCSYFKSEGNHTFEVVTRSQFDQVSFPRGLCE